MTVVGVAIVVIGVVAIAAMIVNRVEVHHLRSFADGMHLTEVDEGSGYELPATVVRWGTVAMAALAAGAVAYALRPNVLVTVSVAGVAAFATDVLRTSRARKLAVLRRTQFADAVASLAAAMRAGNSFSRSLQQVAEGSAEPIRAELERTRFDIELGTSMSDAVRALGDRIDVPEARWLAHVLQVHERTGAPAATLLTEIAAAIRQSESLDLEIRALTAEGRLAAYVVAGLPVGLVWFLGATQPTYLRPFTEGTGVWVSAALVTLVVGGLGAVRHMVRSVEL